MGLYLAERKSGSAAFTWQSYANIKVTVSCKKGKKTYWGATSNFCHLDQLCKMYKCYNLPQQSGQEEKWQTKAVALERCVEKSAILVNKIDMA